MSPESIRGDGYGVRTDVWSLAALIFKFATDFPLFDDIDDVMRWEDQPDLQKISNSNIGHFSKTFRLFFRNMLSIERYRPHSATVFQKSQQYENMKPYQIFHRGEYGGRWEHKWIFIN